MILIFWIENAHRKCFNGISFRFSLLCEVRSSVKSKVSKEWNARAVTPHNFLTAIEIKQVYQAYLRDLTMAKTVVD